MDSYDPQQIAQDRDIIAEAIAKERIRPLFPAGEPRAAGAVTSRTGDEAAEDTLIRMGPPPLGDAPSALGGGHGKGP
mgnify:CR=1 FL=1